MNDENQKQIIEHYDLLIDEGNDPAYDDLPLKEYMDKWDGKAFVDLLNINKDISALEIGVGTGRLALRICDKVKTFTGIDLSPKTIARAKLNLQKYKPNLICDDFLRYEFAHKFDLIYSSLTFFHIERKLYAISKVYELLNSNGLFVLSIEKDTRGELDFCNRKIKLYPDDLKSTIKWLKLVGFELENVVETEFAYLFRAKKC